MRWDRDEGLNIFYGRLNDCLLDIREEIPVDFYEEIRNLKAELAIWAVRASNKNITHAAKMLNLNRTTLTSMMENELAPYIINKKSG